LDSPISSASRIASSMSVSTISAFLHCLDHLAAYEDLTFAIAGRDAEVRLARLAGAIDDATHNGNPERHLEPFQSGSYLVSSL
jgi:hypothetical protein